MSLPSEEEATQAVEAARSALGEALEVLRQVRGDPADEPCTRCDGKGAHFQMGTPESKQRCYRCKGTGRQMKTFPWIVTGVKWAGEALRPSLFDRDTTWVSVLPCSKEFGGKTYLGWLLGDLANGQQVQLGENGVMEISMSFHNPAIFIPELGRIVYGRESYWSSIKSPEDLREITNADIEDVWYVKALKDLTQANRV